MSPQEVMLRDELVAMVRLVLVSGVGPLTRRALLEQFGSAEAVLAASAEALRKVPRVGAKLSRRILAAHREIDVGDELRTCSDHGLDLLIEDQPDYPPPLRDIPDPPGVLFQAGRWLPCDVLSVAIVGTRHATQYGLQQAERLASGLARAGFTIVSGLARGIDAAAHRGAIAAGGRTVAVLGSGILNLYPPEHQPLADDVVRHGALISETPPRMAPQSGMFPQRNRVITGLSLGTIVVEAAERSGALVSARHAMEQGRDVFAMPGRVDSRMSRGCHQLIRDGAKLVESVDDVLEELGPLAGRAVSTSGREVRHPGELQLNEQEQAVLDAIHDQPTLIDDVVTTSRLPVSRVLSTLSVLEMRRLIRRPSGCHVVRA
ncbi:MAG TPA: DNA-processing protein DprA [Pirellulaceae bacterium]|nr:DNA-processing protein DprA [Pirellulaceae bacterium]